MIKLLFSFFFITSFSFAQSSQWWVFLKDKDCDPVVALTQKSIERRAKQNIALDIHDFRVCQSYIDILKSFELKIRHQSRWLNAVSVSIESYNVLHELFQLDFVDHIQPMKEIRMNKYLPESSIFHNNKNYNLRQSYGLPYGLSFNQVDMLGGVDLHNAGFLGSGVTIAVFDAGFTSVDSLPIFDSLWMNSQIIDTYDFVDDDDDVFGGSSHGTMVLSTMGGYMEDSLIGVAPESYYMLFRTEDSVSETLVEEDNWAIAAEYADSLGVDIINSSLGYTILYDDTLNSHSYFDMDGNSTIITMAADLAASRGILVVNSAGNSGNNDWYYIGAPADGDSVLAIGAVNDLGDIASFSSRGPSYDGRIKPNVCAQGVSTVVSDLDSTIRVANGTSFSSPLIAGLAACLWESRPDLNNMEILNLIQQSAHLYDNPNDSLGYGIPNFYEAYLFSSQLNYEKNNVKIYPNPFFKEISIYDYNKTEMYIDIYNVSGLHLFSKKTYESCIVVNELEFYPPGLYFLRINNSPDIYKIIKINEE